VQALQLCFDDALGFLLLGFFDLVAGDVFGVAPLHRRQEFSAKFFAAQHPAALDFFPHRRVLFPAAPFGALAEFPPARRTVPGNARFAQDTIDAQPLGPLRGLQQVGRVTAPAKIRQGAVFLRRLARAGLRWT